MYILQIGTKHSIGSSDFKIKFFVNHIFDRTLPFDRGPRNSLFFVHRLEKSIFLLEILPCLNGGVSLRSKVLKPVSVLIQIFRSKYSNIQSFESNSSI